MNSTPPLAVSNARSVRSVAEPMFSPTRVCRDTSTTSAFSMKPCSAAIRANSRATVVLPVPAGPANTRCCLSSRTGRPALAASLAKRIREISILISSLTEASPTSALSSATAGEEPSTISAGGWASSRRPCLGGGSAATIAGVGAGATGGLTTVAPVRRTPGSSAPRRLAPPLRLESHRSSTTSLGLASTMPSPWLSRTTQRDSSAEELSSRMPVPHRRISALVTVTWLFWMIRMPLPVASSTVQPVYLPPAPCRLMPSPAARSTLTPASVGWLLPITSTAANVPRMSVTIRSV